jgi:hypothetical protein
MSDTYETVDGSKIIPANDIAKYAAQLKRERDQWRECAELFVNSLCRPKGDNPTAKAFAEFDRLKEESK